MKRMKKGLSLLLVLCMLLSMLPMSALAADGAAAETNAASADSSYRIVQVDAGRKYWSVEVLKQLIDEMAKNHYNQLGLYFSDNQGFRFALNNMTFTVDGKNYDLSKALGNGIMQTADRAPVKTEDPNRAHFRPSHEDKWLNETEMKEIISYARKKGIEIVPSFDMPGHMGAILNAPDFEAFKYTGYGTTTNSSFDVTNATAQKVMLAILKRYVQFFAANGCRYFNICSDEFCYDIGHSTADSISNATLCRAIVTFMDEAAKVIVKAKMTPRAFSDYLYADSGYNYSEAYKKYEILFWDKSTNLAECQSRGNKLINVDESCYYALNTKYYTSPDVSVKSFRPDYVATKGSGFTLPNPAGAMLCIWCDGGYLDSEPAEGDAGASVLNQVMNFKSAGQTAATNLLAAFAEKVNAYYNVDTSAVVYDLYVGETMPIRISGVGFQAEEINAKLDQTGVVTASKVETTRASFDGTKPEPVENITSGNSYLISDGNGNYLALQISGQEAKLVNVTDYTAATAWTITEANGKYSIVTNSNSIPYCVCAGDSGALQVHAWGVHTNWMLNDSKGFYIEKQTAWWPEPAYTQYTLAFKDGAWATTEDGTGAAKAYTQGEAADPGETEITFEALAVGSASITLDGVKYTFHVTEKGTEPPVTEPTEAPTDPTEKPTDPTEKPTEPTEAPTEPPVTEPMPTYPVDEETDVYIRVAVNGTRTIQIENQDLSTADKDETNWAPEHAGYTIQYTPYDPGGKLVEMLDPIGGAEVVVTDGTNYLVLNEDETLGTTTDSALATKWKITINSVEGKNFFLSSGDLYLRGKNGGVAAETTAGAPWVYVNGSLKQAWWDGAPAAFLIYDGSRWLLSNTAPANAVVVKGLTPPKDAYSTITFDGKTAGDAGSVKIGETTYHVTVVPESLKDAPALTAYYFITNNKAYGAVSRKHVIQMDAASAYGEQGVPFNRLVEKNATWALSENPLAFWKGVCLPYGKWQSAIGENIGTKGDSIDKTLEGSGFTYIRYYNDMWAWSNTPEKADSWTQIKTDAAAEDQIVAYYLQVTPVTKEITTQVADWGYTQDDGNFNGTGDLTGGYVLLDYAVRYPDLHRNPNNFTRDLTISYHTLVNDAQVKADGSEGNLNRTRRIGVSRAVNSSEYEVYLVTVTPSNDDPSVKLTDGNGTAAAMPNDVMKNSDQLYNGTEYVAWALTEQDYIDSGLPKVKGIGSASTEDKTYAETLGIANYHVGGDCTVDEVWIVRNQAMRITYYIRDKHVEEAPLQVYYYDITDGAAEKPFFEFGIYTKEQEYFTNKVNENEDPVFTTTNKYGVPQDVHKDLSKTGCPPYYRTANYQYVRYEISDGGKTLNLYYKRNAGQVYVVDFGLPVKVTMQKILESAQSISTIDDIASIQISGTMKYGELDTAFGEAKAVTPNDVVFTYTPTSVMNGMETVNIKVNFKQTAGESESTPQSLNSFISILPATTMYYEQGFAAYSDGWTAAPDFKGGGCTQQTALVGDVKDKNAFNYGYDEVYENNADLNRSYAQTNNAGSKVSFTFQGTGVDIYADCTAQSGSVMVLLKKGNTIARVIVVDTRNKGGATGATGFETSLGNTYNIPIVSLRGLEHGEYTVELIHCLSARSDGQPTEARADGFRFDGFRVYDPMNHEADAYYAKDEEANPAYTELRDAQLAYIQIPESYKDKGMYAEQIAEDILRQVHNTGVNIQAYVTSFNSSLDEGVKIDLLDNGPKNELYLRQGETLTVLTVGKGQIGLKSLNDGASVKINSGAAKQINANVDMFYPFAGSLSVENVGSFDEKNAKKVLSVTLLKQFGETGTAEVTEDAIVEMLVRMGIPSEHQGVWENPFTDVKETNWFYGAVAYVSMNGLFKGTSATTFSPKAEMTRGMLATVLYRMAGEPEVTGTCPFVDVHAGDYYEKAVTWAAEKDIVRGVGGNRFEPKASITRQDMVVMLYRYALSEGKIGLAGVELASFADEDDVRGYALEAMAWAVANGLVMGYRVNDQYLLRPKRSISRAEVAAIMERVAPILK